MALYKKKLHIRKDGVVTDINLWTEKNEVGSPALAIRHDDKVVYAKLGAVDDALASALRVRKDGIVYAALKNRWVMINIVQSANQTITVTAGEKTYTESFSVPYGTLYTVTITAAAGFAPGALSSSGGTAEGDVTISATPASASLTSGSISGTGTLNFTVPGGATVIKLVLQGNYSSDEYFVGIKANSVMVNSLAVDWWNSPSGEPDDPDRQDLTTMSATVVSGGTWNNNAVGWTFEYNSSITVYWGPEINAHGPTDGSVA